jgi:hypothetical protein
VLLLKLDREILEINHSYFKCFMLLAYFIAYNLIQLRLKLISADVKTYLYLVYFDLLAPISSFLQHVDKLFVILLDCFHRSIKCPVL